MRVGLLDVSRAGGLRLRHYRCARCLPSAAVSPICLAVLVQLFENELEQS